MCSVVAKYSFLQESNKQTLYSGTLNTGRLAYQTNSVYKFIITRDMTHNQ